MIDPSVSLIGAASGLIMSITALITAIRTRSGTKTRIHNIRAEAHATKADLDIRFNELIEALRADVDDKTKAAMIEGIATGHRIAMAQKDADASDLRSKQEKE